VSVTTWSVLTSANADRTDWVFPLVADAEKMRREPRQATRVTYPRVRSRVAVAAMTRLFRSGG
jgi:hypothetical protein